MKKIIYIASIFFASIFSGCDDFLTVESPDFSTDKYWRNKDDVEAGLSAVYGQLENRTDAYALGEIRAVVETFRGDDITTGQDVNNYPEWGQMYNFTYTNENSRIKSYWMNNYNGINYANNVIFGIDKVQAGNNPMNQEDYSHTMGEAVFLRAYYHFKLIMNWKEIIIRDEYLTSEAQTHKALSSRIDCWDFVCSELSRAGSMLPETRPSQEAGRVTKGAAYAYLGWADLTRAYEEPEQKEFFLSEAMKALNNVSGYELVDNYESLFNGTNKNSSEAIFELQFTNTTADGTYHKHVLHYWLAAPSMGGWDEIRISPMMYNEYLKEGRIAENNMYDARAYGSMIFDDPYYTENPNIYGMKYDEVFEGNPEVSNCFKKYLPASLEEFNQSAVATNIPLMRYANVMLMKAEIYNEQNLQDEAIPLINKIRKIHGRLPEMTGKSYEDVKAQIEHERLVEFALENVRFYDLRRWGKLKEAMQAAGRTNFNVTEDEFLPIPLMEIQSNNEIN